MNGTEITSPVKGSTLNASWNFRAGDSVPGPYATNAFKVTNTGNVPFKLSANATNAIATTTSAWPMNTFLVNAYLQAPGPAPQGWPRAYGYGIPNDYVIPGETVTIVIQVLITAGFGTYPQNVTYYPGGTLTYSYNMNVYVTQV